jgi:riboflavin kinase/FMN adenylyltransferase
MSPETLRIDGGATASRGGVLAIGNFDGVHRGHQHVLEDALRFARARGWPMAVLTFDPHPALVLGRAVPPPLTTLERKAQLLRRIGVDEVVVKHFDTAFAALSPERFVTDLLEGVLGARAVVVGQNFRFGHARAGDRDMLERLGQSHGFEVRSFELAGDAVGAYSSTRVREALARGDLKDANHVLGRPHAFSGIVAQGDQRGRTIGFPTANVEDVVELVPMRGVYAVFVDVLDDHVATPLAAGVMNVGVRPTVSGEGRRTQEVHLFDFAGDLYSKHLRVHVVERIREERKFATLDELKAQIALDAERARAIASLTTPRPC